MIAKVLTLGTKATWWAAKRTARGYRTETSIALGLLGAAITANEAYKAKQRATAMCGKIVVVMGGSRGLGLEIARQFGLGGGHLVLVSRNEEELRNALGKLQAEGAIPNGAAAHIVVADVSRQEDCERAIASAMERFGRVDVLINCAAVMQVAPFEDMTTEAFHKAMDINFFGALYAIQAVVPHMLQRGSGNIVNIASVGGKIAVPHMLPYVASKFALVGFSEGLHAELRHKGIRVTTVCPGLMRTGAESGVKFAGNAEKEYAWFKFGAEAPLVSISARAAARKIFAATVAGKAEITITPQAWLGARAVGLAPNFSQQFAAAVNHLGLPAANGNRDTTTGAEIEAKQ
ncbi:SDR family NAD(P)-dependent oxidoreductase [Terriglobus roseus]|uniref:Short-chain dehydrogenase n=1 Tax=Terriglobus roseus TaxID=392734 RepID=A0A1H4R1T0_9BACT|nr:SDR family NAD(P)-dependent oxidoreductase [Terriglobus roseus]SEC25823.1 Short-chain dehydrogenase [Terriglobus roseus]